MATRRKSTSTSSFGVSRREAHDASGFYARFTPPEICADDRIEPGKAIDRIFRGDARAMAEVPDRSVALVVTSPPYFAGKEYEEALGQGHIPGSYLEYLAMLEDVFAECVRTLEPGGRIAVNVANLGRKPYRSLASDVIAILQDRLRLLLRGEVIWQKARGSTGSCAWGSFQRAANPVLRDLTERVVIASKGRFDRALTPRRREELGLPHASSISRDEFMEATTDLWEIPPESATRVGHPAPFPVELPERLIRLYTYVGDLVLDPFMGSGTTAVAAVRTGRHFVGYETDPSYVEAATRRVASDAHTRPPQIALLPVPTGAPPEGDGSQARAVSEGRGARDIAESVLESCGFRDIQRDIRLTPGVEISFRARGRSGHRWLFDVAGGFTSNRPGLRRADTLWKALGKALVLGQTEPHIPLVLLTTHAPEHGSAGDLALRAVCGPGKPVTAVLEMLSPPDLQRLRELCDAGPPRGDGQATP